MHRRSPWRRESPTAGRVWTFAGTLLVVVLVILLIVFASPALFSRAANSLTPGVARSTVRRVRLSEESVDVTAYYEDRAGCLKRNSSLLSSLEEFHEKTGVQPYLYISDDLDEFPAASDAETEVFAEELYRRRFTDEGHLLVIFQMYGTDGSYSFWFCPGSQAAEVFDAEAEQIFLDYADRTRFSPASAERFFATVFSKTGERIMSKTISPAVTVLILAGTSLATVWAVQRVLTAVKRREREARRARHLYGSPVGNSRYAASAAELKYRRQP